MTTDLQAYNTGITVHVACVCYNSLNDSSDNEILIQYPEREVFTRLDRLGIMTMDPVSGDFQPLNFLTRAEAAKIVVAMRAVENPVSEAGVFSDVPSDHWAYPYVGTALEWGIVSGTGDGMFEPDREITHSEFMKMLVTLLGYAPKADGMGGYPGGYLRVAQELNLPSAEGIDGNALITREQAAYAVNTALSTPLRGEDGSVYDGVDLPLKTLMTEYRD